MHTEEDEVVEEYVPGGQREQAEDDVLKNSPGGHCFTLSFVVAMEERAVEDGRVEHETGTMKSRKRRTSGSVIADAS